MEFETEALSNLIAEFAMSSPSGLRSALSIRDTMTEKGLLVSAVGLSGILMGALEYGLKRGLSGNSTLLVAEADRARVAEEELARRDFFLTSSRASSLAYEILDDHFKRDTKKPPKKLISEVVRLLFNVELVIMHTLQCFKLSLKYIHIVGWCYGIRRNLRHQFRTRRCKRK